MLLYVLGLSYGAVTEDFVNALGGGIRKTTVYNHAGSGNGAPPALERMWKAGQKNALTRGDQGRCFWS